MRSWFFEKINKIDKALARLTRVHRDNILINKIRMKRQTEQHILNKSKTPSDPSTKGYTQQNWKTWKKWTNF
jgi:CRISPR/Cas system-associated endoribonuclease Cas2